MHESSRVVLKGILLPSALTMFPNSEDFFFQQNNVPWHTARSINMWIEDHKIKTLYGKPTLQTLNPIENLLYVIKRRMDGQKPSNNDELVGFLCQEWDKVLRSIPTNSETRESDNFIQSCIQFTFKCISCLNPDHLQCHTWRCIHLPGTIKNIFSGIYKIMNQPIASRS